MHCLSSVVVIIAWWHMIQGNLCIGVALSIVGLAMVTNSIEGRKMRMTVTVHRAAACVLGISCTLTVASHAIPLMIIALVKWSYRVFAVFRFQHHTLFIVGKIVCHFFNT